MKKLPILLLLCFATLVSAMTPRSTNFTASDAGSYVLYKIDMTSEGQHVILENTTGTTWCYTVGTYYKCDSVSELTLTMNFNSSGGISLNGNNVYADNLTFLDIEDYPGNYNFTFSDEGMTLSFNEEDAVGSMLFKKDGAAPVQTNEQQTKYTQELQELEYGSKTRKAKVQEIKRELLATTASEVSEVASGNGLIVTYKDGYSGLIYTAPKNSKGSATHSIGSKLQEKLKIFQHAATRSGNKKVLAIAAQYWDWGSNDDVPQLALMLKANGFDVTYKKYKHRKDGLMSDFENWGDYAIVLISTHGIARDTRSRAANSINMAIDLNIAPDAKSVTSDDLNKKRLIEWDNCTEDGTCHKSLLATNLFFEKHLSSLPNTLVYVSACHVGKNDALAEVLFNKGAETMIGYSDLVQVSFAKEHGVNIFTRYIGNESLDSIFSLPGDRDISTGYHTGIKEKDDTPAEIVIYQKEGVNYETYLAKKSYDIMGSFAAHDFSGVGKAFDWVFSTTSGTVFQLQGVPATSDNVFGWKAVKGVTNLSPAWYMFPLGDDVDGDGNEKFDWIFIGAGSKAVYKLAGVKKDGTFQYSKAINLSYTIKNNKVTFSK